MRPREGDEAMANETVFTFEAPPVVFGEGARRHLAAEVDALRGDRVMLIAQGDADEITGLLGDRVVLRWEEIAQHVPIELAERAREAALEAGIVWINAWLLRDLKVKRL